MSICPSNDFQNVQPEAAVLHIQRIEVFVIPALAVDANGYRVCLRISSNRGYGWSEIFIDDSDISFHLQDWEHQLTPFVGPSTISNLTELISNTLKQYETYDQRAIYLFTNALHQLNFLPDGSHQAQVDEELILRSRAVSYLSLY
ncbi:MULTISPECIES: hypothetical protein [Paenibacillus]|uniref:hypothetical protein n=1 Tax=Paenibacillus TaxID=44249 RepID=UPI00204028A0|nr:hypothetical protein [Paenibacillus camelliae]MCM3632563.1 hypothetical protein [Paenibacillus camelliae]